MLRDGWLGRHTFLLAHRKLTIPLRSEDHPLSFLSFAVVRTARSISSKLLASDAVELFSIRIRGDGCV